LLMNRLDVLCTEERSAPELLGIVFLYHLV
jgi:hypothetical protein